MNSGQEKLYGVFMIYFFIAYSTAIFLLIAGIVFYLVPKLNKAHIGTDEKSRLSVRQLYFVSGMVGVLGLIFLESMGMYYFSCSIGLCNDGIENPGKVIFEACLKIIPPLVTLVLGYYFGRKENGEKENVWKNIKK